MAPDTQQISAADLPGDDVSAAMGSDDIAAIAEQLATAVGDVEAAAGGMGQPDPLAGAPAEEDAGTSDVAAAAAKQPPAPVEGSSDEVHGIGLRPSQTTDDGAADAE